jgi:hypothetical protein
MICQLRWAAQGRWKQTRPQVAEQQLKLWERKGGNEFDDLDERVGLAGDEGMEVEMVVLN